MRARLRPRGPSPQTEAYLLRKSRLLFFIALGAALLPIVVATVRTLVRHWVPIGDDSFFSIRAWDVFTSHPPLLGTWTSASQSVGTDINNPGPLFFDALAVPVRLFGSIDGLAIGSALLNLAAVSGIAVVAYRRGGAVLGSAAMLVTAVMCWAMGSELLYDPWQPHSLLLPFLFFMMATWALSCGDLVMLPWAVGVGSLVVETHLTYAYLVPALGLWGVAGYFLTSRRWAGHERSNAVRKGRRASWWRVVSVTAVVVVLGWAQPVWEQFTGPGDGNITRLVESLSTSHAAPIGFDRGTRLVATVLALPPWWLRPSFNDAFAPAEGGSHAGPGGIGVASLPSLPLAIGGLLVIAAIFVICARDARRRRDTEARRAVTTAAIAILVGLYTAGTVPRTVFGVAPHQFRWIWPVAAFMTFAALATYGARVLQLSSGRRAGVLVVSFVGITALVAVLNLPTYRAHAGPTADSYAIPVVRDLDSQLGGLKGYGTLLYDFHNVQFAEPYSTAIMAELQRRGVPFVVDVPGLVRQLGENRRYDGTNARYRILYRIGEDTLDPPPSLTEVAFHHGLGMKEHAQMNRLKAEIADEMDAGRLKLTAFGRAAIAQGRYAVLAAGLRGDASAADVFKSRQFTSGFEDGVLDVKPPWTARFKRYVTLQREWDRAEVAVYVAPIN